MGIKANGKRNKKKLKINLTDASTEVTKFTADLSSCGSFLQIYNTNHLGCYLAVVFLLYFISLTLIVHLNTWCLFCEVQLKRNYLLTN